MIPRDAVAFAAGMHAVSDHPWEVIAGAVSQAGLGTFEKTELEMAVRDFCAELTDRWERGEVPSERETARRVRRAASS